MQMAVTPQQCKTSDAVKVLEGSQQRSAHKAARWLLLEVCYFICATEIDGLEAQSFISGAATYHLVVQQCNEDCTYSQLKIRLF